MGLIKMPKKKKLNAESQTIQQHLQPEIIILNVKCDHIICIKIHSFSMTVHFLYIGLQFFFFFFFFARLSSVFSVIGEMLGLAGILRVVALLLIH